MWHLNKIPKIIHFYWGGAPLSFLQYLSVETFKKLNPDWEIQIHVPEISTITEPTWTTFEQKSHTQLEKDYFSMVVDLDVTIIQHNFENYDFSNDAHEVHKSDLLRWHLLSTVGGVWSDFDILYQRPITSLAENTDNNSNADTVLCRYHNGRHAIGFIMSAPNNDFYLKILNLSKQNFKKESYQSIGSELIENNYKNIESYNQNFPNLNFIFLNPDCVYSITYNHVDHFYQGYITLKNRNKLNNTEIIGYHWYAGHPLSKTFEKEFHPESIDTTSNILVEVIKNNRKHMISIVMAYYNRLPQLTYTLQTIAQFNETNFEIIIVDDFSSEEHSLNNIAQQFPSLNIKVIKMSERHESKWYRNPCVPFNTAFREATGDIILIQNPESAWMGNIIDHARKNLTEKNYLSYHCYWVTEADSNELQNSGKLKFYGRRFSSVKNINSGWCNHKTYLPLAYNYACAITRKNLTELNGFDEIYALGHCAEDDDFILRIKNKNLTIEFVEDPFVVHVWHPTLYKDLQPLQDNQAIWKEHRNRTDYQASKGII